MAIETLDEDVEVFGNRVVGPPKVLILFDFRDCGDESWIVGVEVAA
jgi:hypothetical protein